MLQAHLTTFDHQIQVPLAGFLAKQRESDKDSEGASSDIAKLSRSSPQRAAEGWPVIQQLSPRGGSGGSELAAPERNSTGVERTPTWLPRTYT